MPSGTDLFALRLGNAHVVINRMHLPDLVIAGPPFFAFVQLAKYPRPRANTAAATTARSGSTAWGRHDTMRYRICDARENCAHSALQLTIFSSPVVTLTPSCLPVSRYTAGRRMTRERSGGYWNSEFSMAYSMMAFKDTPAVYCFISQSGL
jgi:hypothetical protein